MPSAGLSQTSRLGSPKKSRAVGPPTVTRLAPAREPRFERGACMTARRRSTRLAERFARIPLSVLESDALRTLPHAAFRVLVILTSQYSGWNNGTLALTPRYAERHGFKGRDTI